MMQITRVELTDFGKFHNYQLNFSHDFIYLYGANEAGKSTLFQFIVGIFYGFSKDNPTKKIYNENYDRYKPLHSPNYRGALELIKEGRKYRIERNFLKGEESLAIWDVEGRTLMEEDPRLYTYSKIPQPGALFFQMDQNSFLSFYALQDVEEFSHKTFLEEELYKSKNFMQGDHPDIDVEQGLSYFDAQIKEIGSRGRKRSKLGLLAIELGEIEQQAQKMFQRQDAYEKIQKEEQKVEEALINYRREDEREEINRENKSPSELLLLLENWEEETREIALLYQENEEKIEEIERQREHKYQNFQPGREKVFFILSILSLLGAILIFGISRSEYALLLLLPAAFLFIFGLFIKNKGKHFRLAMENYHHFLAEQDMMMDKIQRMVTAYNENFPTDSLNRHLEVEKYPEILKRRRSMLLSDLDRKTHQRDRIRDERSREFEKLREREIYLAYQKRDLLKEQEMDRKRADEIKNLREQERALLRELDLLHTGQEILQNILEQQSESAKYEFIKRSEEILRELSLGKYSEIYFVEGDFFIGDGEVKLDFEHMSTSTKEILLLSLRLAMVSMRGRDRTPLFMDDSFVHFDQIRKEGVHTLLHAIDRQIFLFSLEKPVENLESEIQYISL